MAPRGKTAKAKAPKTFDERVLTQLTAKIEKKLDGKPDWVKGQVPPKSNDNRKPEHGGKRKRQDGAPADAPSKEPQSKKGRPNPRKQGPRPDAQTNGDRQPKGKTPASTLLEEIRALGGDEKDLELIENVDSDAEEGDGPKKPKEAEEEVDDGLKNELAAFAASLGLEKLRQEVEAESEEGEDEEEVEEPEPEEEAEEEDEVEEEQEQPEPQIHEDRRQAVREEKPTREERNQDKNGKLVSKHL